MESRSLLVFWTVNLAHVDFPLVLQKQPLQTPIEALLVQTAIDSMRKYKLQTSHLLWNGFRLEDWSSVTSEHLWTPARSSLLEALHITHVQNGVLLEDRLVNCNSPTIHLRRPPFLKLWARTHYVDCKPISGGSPHISMCILFLMY